MNVTKSENFVTFIREILVGKLHFLCKLLKNLSTVSRVEKEVLHLQPKLINL